MAANPYYFTMVDSNLFNIPLSPPTSPRLSGNYQAEQVEHSWQDQQPKVDTTPDSSEGNMVSVHSEVPNLSLDTKPRLANYSLRAGLHPDTPPLNSTGGSPGSGTPDDLGPGLDEIPSAELPSVTFGGSAPASPMSAMSPGSPLADGEHGLSQTPELGAHAQDLNGLNITLDPTEEGEKKQMSAAEIRNQKRKMKRFR